MDNFNDIEQELRKLSPASPSAALQNRLEQHLDASSSHNNEIKRVSVLTLRWAVPLAMAAVLALAAYLNFSENPPATNPPTLTFDNKQSNSAPVEIASRFVPVKARQMLIGAKEEGIYFDSEHRPARKMRYRFIDSYMWKNPADGSSLQITVPREEVFLVRLHTY